MDAADGTKSRSPPQRSASSGENLDRFIPNRSAMDFDYAHYMLTQHRTSKKAMGNQSLLMRSPSEDAYQKHLAETFSMNRTRILAFKNKPLPDPAKQYQSSQPTRPIRRYIPRTAEQILNAPDMLDDYNLNLLDWSSSNVVSIALESRVYLWYASRGTVLELPLVDDDDEEEEINGPVTSIKWARDGQHIAVGSSNSDVKVWDYAADRLVATLKGGSHRNQCRVGSLDWRSDQILTTGRMDGKITNHDIRVRRHKVQTFKGHHQEVCGLKWSACGQQLASGGDDNLLHIWDCRSMASSSSNAKRQWLHRFNDHSATVKALAWCPFQCNLLASGGSDRCIKFWNSQTGASLNSVDTGSQVCALLWNKNERELLSSHGFPRNQLTLWKYPSMVRITELTGHTSRVLFMAQNPKESTVVSAAGDETLRFWNVFGNTRVAKPAPKMCTLPFANLNSIR